ncbi:DNA polymerase epsilon subunit 3 [Empidonax traillii]|nr:DNA polymerase epsilon subunit 3 [Empidonax traillii]
MPDPAAEFRPGQQVWLKHRANRNEIHGPTNPTGHGGSSQLPLFYFLFLPCFFPSANNFAMKGKRKTLNAGDVLSAMEEMEFQRFMVPLKESLEVYRREQKGKKEARKDKDKKADSEEQDKSREEDNDDDDERMEEEEQNDEEEVDN